ncbi:transporter substrate-binding domain-containing protein [Frigidibacter albus]|uniref:Transporter substrate-binding domain-containing protein n=1 Tax=Frigidibacter albus TaxID=1465486 RepID=A0A6L8VH17_9RHOB|nr:transporter substrate-binding domain-containing protein [Frigidibacter albus]MZQ89698.1 transporter substrate-binding domain-containing protein [Frigidibacter albus]NBE31604.1 transporter substrate-binding domain-containing protein [Frigidibacter albus]GGH54626.1 ectoine/hydroxyectoine ABC transporter substrate-binding protein EhuB [Frigidibacter albus]
MKFAYLIEPPFNDRDASGAVLGHDVEIARHVFAELGAPFEPVEAEFAQLLPGLAEGHWQMTTGLFATPERGRIAAFTHPIWALPDGLLVRAGNPLGLAGYRSVAAHGSAVLAVIQDQLQHRSAVAFGMPDARLRIFETYSEAAEAVRDGRADGYASVARAHAGFLAQRPGLGLESVDVPHAEKPPAFGAFAVALDDRELLGRVNAVLAGFLGSVEHRDVAGRYGFSDGEVDLVTRE